MTGNDVIVVVGNVFEHFSSNKPVITLSQLDALLKLPPNILPGRRKILLGQGVNGQECKHIVNQLRLTPNLQDRFDVSDLEKMSDLAPCALSHKHKPVNTLIGAPRRVDSDIYILRLLVDERSELMNDHQTGQHVQGIVQIEAVRQSFLAVTEAFYPIPNVSKLYFVINGMDVAFHKFLFPLPAEIQYRSVEADLNERRGRHVAEIKIIQGGQICMLCTVRFTVYPYEVISEKEEELASASISELLHQAVTLSLAANNERKKALAAE